MTCNTLRVLCHVCCVQSAGTCFLCTQLHLSVMKKNLPCPCPAALRCMTACVGGSCRRLISYNRESCGICCSLVTGLAFTPQLYRCGIAFSGMSNLASFVATMPQYWAPIRNRWLLRVGNVTGDAAVNRRLSPIFHANNIRAPLLIGQGSNDVRVAQVRLPACPHVRTCFICVMFNESASGACMQCARHLFLDTPSSSLSLGTSICT